MRRLLAAFVVVLIALTSVVDAQFRHRMRRGGTVTAGVAIPGGGGGGGSLMSVPGDLTYAGAFMEIGPDPVDYESGTGDCAYSATGTLYCLHGTVGSRLSEFSIPTLYTGSTYATLNTPTYTAGILQGPVNAFGTQIECVRIGCPDQGTQYGVGIAISGTTLILSAYDGYGDPDLSHFRRSTTLATTTIDGPWKMTQSSGPAMPVSFTTGAMIELPAAWQSSFGGKTHIGGIGGMSIISRTSIGPSAHVFNLADLVAGGNADSKAVLFYSEHIASGTPCNSSYDCLMYLGADVAWYMEGGKTQTAANTAYFMNPDGMRGMAIPEGYRTLLVFGTHATGTFCYGLGGPYVVTGSGSGGDPYTRYSAYSLVAEGDLDDGLSDDPPISNVGDSRCADPAVYNKGEHGYPYKAWVWAYDLNDLAAAYAGTMQPYDVMPYASVELPEMDRFVTSNMQGGIMGAGHDRSGKRLIINGHANGGAIVRVARVYTYP